MRLTEQRDYRGCTLLLFEERVSEESTPHARHWIVIGPDGINIVGAPVETEAEARKLVDSTVRGGRPD